MSRTPVRPEELVLGRRPFRGSLAVARGLITWSALRSSAWRRLFRDVYVDARVTVDHRLLIAGALLLIPDGAAIAGRSAAHIWGAASVGELGLVEVLSPRRFGPIAGLCIRVADMPPGESVIRQGVRVTSCLHTAWDVARYLPLREAVPLVDSLARTRRLDLAEAIAHGAGHPGAPGLRRAAATLKLCDRLAESPPESVLRLELHLVGIMVVPQHWIMVAGEFVARVDLALPEIKLAIEYDGQWHGDHHQLGRDRRRVRLLNSAGWQVFQVTKEDMRNIPRLLEEIRSKIRRMKRI